MRAQNRSSEPAPADSLLRPGVIEREGLDQLLDALRARGFTVIGPAVRQGAIVYDEIHSVDDLPAGWRDEQDAATYRISKSTDNMLFGYNLGPHSWKRYLHPPTVRLYQAEREASSFRIVPEQAPPPRLAFLGVRACELRAMAIQDRVFTAGPYVDPRYRERREQTCVIAVNCSQAGGTCFCVSMGAGPRAPDGYDLCLTEVVDAARRYFVVEVGTDLGASLLDAVAHEVASDDDMAALESVVARTAAQMGRVLDVPELPQRLSATLEHPRWDLVASRCLSCGNCTLVCPTCFCTAVRDVSDLNGARAERWRSWDSCFTTEFSYIAGGSVRASPKGRYRQWLIHKLSTWHDQFGMSGCVGCGRCITWCPARIDITEEAAAIGAGALAPVPPEESAQ